MLFFSLLYVESDITMIKNDNMHENKQYLLTITRKKKLLILKVEHNIVKKKLKLVRVMVP